MTEFSLAGYGALLSEFLDRGYGIRTFENADPEAAHLILRHDIDLSLEAAVPVAEIEAAAGHSATYFVLLRGDFYNPLSGSGMKILRRLIELGHEIGLHLDPSLYADEDAALDAAAESECAVLESALDRPVGTISFHRPAGRLQGFAGRLGGRRHAYEPRYFSEMGYCSDSRGAWRHGPPLEHTAVAAGRALQLLTHPIWWQRLEGESVQQTLERFALERYRTSRVDLGRNSSVFDPSLPPPE